MRSARDIAGGLPARARSRVILLPSGDGGRVLSLTPPLCIEADALIQAIDLLGRLIGEVAAGSVPS